MDIQEVKKKVENAKTELTRSEERLKQAEEKLGEVLEEIKKTGNAPAKLPDIIKDLKKELGAENVRIGKQVELAQKALGETDGDEDPFEGI